MTLTEMAKELGLKDTASIRRLIIEGKLKAEKKGKTWLVSTREVERYRLERLGRVGFPKGKARPPKAKITETTQDAPTPPVRRDDSA